MTIALPRTRGFQRNRPMRLWWLAVGIALLANLAVIVGLSQVSALHHDVPAAPLTVRTLRQTAPPPPPAPVDPPPEAHVEQVSAALPVALPILDLPEAGPVSSLALPDLGTLDATLDLPLTVPAFAAVGAPTATAPIAGIDPGQTAFDSPAERDGAFDLDRFFPRSAKMRGITGSSRVRLAIAADGHVSGVEVLESSPTGVFEQAAERLALSLHFRPATKAGRPVASTQETIIAWTIR